MLDQSFRKKQQTPAQHYIVTHMCDFVCVFSHIGVHATPKFQKEVMQRAALEDHV